MIVAVSADLLERGHEVSAIEVALDAALTGLGAVVLLEGEAGIGKSRLVDLACVRAHSSAIQVLRARGAPLERQLPFGVTRQLFESALRRAEPDERSALLGGAAASANTVLLNDTPAQSESSPDVARVLHGLYWLCANFTEGGATLLAIDDAHWSDSESLRWLSYMANRVGGLPLLLLVAARPSEAPADAAALAAIASAPEAELLRLAPLSERSSARLVRGIRGRDTDDEFCRACHAAAGGNPFYLRELSLESEHQAIEPVARAAPRIARLGPQTVAHAMRLRLAHLPESCAALAYAIAVLGLDVELRDAAALAGIPIETAQGAADLLAGAGVLRPARPLNFKHPVIGTATYADLLPGARSQAHARAAEILTENGADPARVGAHLLLVEPATDAGVLKQLRSAASDALLRGAPATAVGYLRRALAETNDSQTRVEVLIELGRAMLTAGDPSAVTYLMEVIDAEPGNGVLVEAVALAGSALQFANRQRDALDLMQRTLDRLDSTTPEQDRMRLESIRLQMAAADPEFTGEVQAGLPALLERAHRSGRAGHSILIVGALAAATEGDSARQVRPLVTRGLQHEAMSEEVADSTIPAWAIISLIVVDELDAADDLLEAVIADARARGSVHAYAGALLWRGWVALRRGLIPAAESDERAAADLATQHGLRLVLPWASAFLTGALIERGQIEAAAGSADAEAARYVAPLAGIALDARGRLRIAQGRYDEGVEDLRRAGAVHESIATYNPNLLHWRSSVALALRRDSLEARTLVDVELERARQLRYPRAIGVALRALGLLQAPDAGCDTLREAAAVLERSPARLEYARTLFHLGAALRRCGRRAAARDPLRESLDLADRLGAEGLVTQALAELAAAGGRPRRRRLEGIASLTPSERRIAGMAARGATDKEIAQALFISRKTVEMHLSRTYRKLSIHSRTDLPVLLTEAPQDR